MRPKLALGALSTVVALAVLVLAAPAASAHGKGKHMSPLVLVAEENQMTFVDLTTPGPSLGDQRVFSETLFRRHHEVGTSGGACTITEVTPPYPVLTLNCVVTLSLRKGQITLQGLIEIQGQDDPGPFELAITGGPRKYHNAGGEARFRNKGDGIGVYKLKLAKAKPRHRHGHH